MEKPIYQHLTEVTNACSDTEPAMFILQGNKLYLEMGTLGPFFMLRSSTSRVASFCYLVFFFIALFPMTGICFLNG
jgi:hypothetical protein